MIVQYASDLHLEFEVNRRFVLEGGIKPAGDVLVLAGDVANLFALSSYDAFWDWCAKNWAQTIFVPGNHDYYGAWPSREAMLGPLRLAIRPNVHCCLNTVMRLENVDFVCSTLWSRVSPEETLQVQSLLLDFKEIAVEERLLTVADYNALFESSWRFVQKAVGDCAREGREKEEKGEKGGVAHDIVVVTHHVPTFAAVADYRLDSPVGTGFTTELSSWIAESPVSTWIYGHSHDSVEVEINRTQVRSNQLGYLKFKEGRGFKASKTFICG